MTMLARLSNALVARRRPGFDRIAPADAGRAEGGVAFFMPVFRDAEVAGRALERLRAAYPEARVTVLSDGDDAFPGASIAERFDVTYELGANLYGLDHGGAMIVRMLDRLLDGPERLLVRLDSDARVDRPFALAPREDGLYGSIGARSGAIQGGAILLTRGAAQRLRDARVFERGDIRSDPAGTWGRYCTEDSLARKLRDGRIAYDKVLHWGCVECGVPVRAHPEIFSVWKPFEGARAGLANADGRAAVVHPDKMDGTLPVPGSAP